MLGNLYLISLVLGGILLVVSMFGDFFEVDDITSSDPGGLHILTLRGVTYFLFVFGATGAAMLRFADVGSIPTAVLATVAGLATAMGVDRVFGYLRGSASGDMESDSSLHGLIGDVVIPISIHGGKIAVRRGSERVELLAKPFAEEDGNPAEWKHVRIIDVRDGTALVEPSKSDL